MGLSTNLIQTFMFQDPRIFLKLESDLGSNQFIFSNGNGGQSIKCNTGLLDCAYCISPAL